MAVSQEWLDETYENKLLRIIAGHLHLLLLRESAATLFSKPLDSLTEEERKTAIHQTMDGVLSFAMWANRETLGMPPGGLDPSGKAH